MNGNRVPSIATKLYLRPGTERKHGIPAAIVAVAALAGAWLSSGIEKSG